MIDDLIERAWCCLNRISPSADKKPPDNNNLQNFKAKLNQKLDDISRYNSSGDLQRCRQRAEPDWHPPSDPKMLEEAFQDLLVRFFFPHFATSIFLCLA